MTEADRVETRSIGELVSNVQKRGYPDFTRYASTSDGGSVVVPCSPETVARAVEWAVGLGLVDRATGRPTRRGSQGVDLEKFDDSLAKGAQELLREIGAPFERIVQTCSRLFERHARGGLPTWENLAAALEIEDARDVDRFRTCLSLLEASGGIAASRRKLYTPS